MNSSFAPHTPGTMYGSDHSYSPYNQSSSPAPSPYPGTFLGTPSPSTYSPNTPGGAPQSPYNPQTPGASLESHNGDWCTTDIEIKIHRHDDTALVGQTGIIRTFTGGVCSVFLRQEERVVSIVCEDLQPVQPDDGDEFKVIYGDDKEATGVVISKANSEIIGDINGDKKMLPISYVCKAKLDSRMPH